jgi:hypothetical protein
MGFEVFSGVISRPVAHGESALFLFVLQLFFLRVLINNLLNPPVNGLTDSTLVPLEFFLKLLNPLGQKLAIDIQRDVSAHLDYGDKILEVGSC